MVRAMRTWMLAALAALSISAKPADPVRDRAPIKALVIAATPEELQPWIAKLSLSIAISIPGMAASFPAVLCNADAVCAVATGPGKASAAATIAAIAYSSDLDLRSTYFVIADLARIDPTVGTTASVVWVTDAVDAGIAWEIDARTLPTGWMTGYLPIDAMSPTGHSPVTFGTEHFAIAPALIAKARALAGPVTLQDSPAAMAYRAMYSEPTAMATPTMLLGATATSDTYWHGALLGHRAHAWVDQLTGGTGTYTTMQQTDNAVLGVLARAAAAGMVDATRAVVIHAAWHFDRQHASQTAYDSLRADAGARAPALANLVAAGSPLVADIVASWPAWQMGVPP